MYEDVCRPAGEEEYQLRLGGICRRSLGCHLDGIVINEHVLQLALYLIHRDLQRSRTADGAGNCCQAEACAESTQIFRVSGVQGGVQGGELQARTSAMQSINFGNRIKSSMAGCGHVHLRLSAVFHQIFNHEAQWRAPWHCHAGRFSLSGRAPVVRRAVLRRCSQAMSPPITWDKTTELQQRMASSAQVAHIASICSRFLCRTDQDASMYRSERLDRKTVSAAKQGAAEQTTLRVQMFRVRVHDIIDPQPHTKPSSSAPSCQTKLSCTKTSEACPFQTLSVYTV